MSTKDERAAKKRADYAANPQKYKDATRRYRQANREKVNAANRARHKRADVDGRRRQTLAKYGLSQAAFDEMLAAQGGRCACCPQPLFLSGAQRKTAPQIDHDHDTGRVRGLLCHGCNVTAGFIEKNLTRTLDVVSYLERHTSNTLDSSWPAD